MVVAFTTVSPVPATVPNSTWVAAVNPVPLTVTVVPPSSTSYASVNNLRTMPFTVENGESISDTFTLTVTGSSGLTISSATSVVIPANGFVVFARDGGD